MAAAALGILSLAATVGVAMFLITSRMPRDETMSFGLTVALTRDEGLELHPALSPDGMLRIRREKAAALLVVQRSHRIETRGTNGGI